MLLSLFALGAVTGAAIVRRQAPEIKTDTIRVTDTLRESTPIYIRSYIRDTLRVAVTDTLRERDTLYISLPREVREYKSDDYRAIVSGYRPALDSMEVYRHTEYINSVQYLKAPPKRWGVGVQIGAGATLSGNAVKLSPYIGVGVSYNILVW